MKAVDPEGLATRSSCAAAPAPAAFFPAAFGLAGLDAASLLAFADGLRLFPCSADPAELDFGFLAAAGVAGAACSVIAAVGSAGA